MELIQYPQKNDDGGIADKIIALEKTAWPENAPDGVFPSAPNTYVTSFVLIEKDQAICHVGVRKCAFCHKADVYLAYGLSEVVTHPRYQKRGLATQTIQKAKEFILSQQPDVSIFTCGKERVPFYARCGWEAVPGACLVGGTKKKPFRSDDLNLITMIMFLSSKSIQHKKDFENTDILLELGENQLW